MACNIPRHVLVYNKQSWIWASSGKNQNKSATAHQLNPAQAYERKGNLRVPDSSQITRLYLHVNHILDSIITSQFGHPRTGN